MESLKELDYLNVLKALEAMPFGIGKNLLIDFLQGSQKNDSIKRNRLDKKELFGRFELLSRGEIEGIAENLINNGLIDYVPLDYNRFIKVLALTPKGKQEILNPSLHKRKLSASFAIKQTQITEKDRLMFESFDFFLKNYNEDQKKAIVCDSEKILCIAGAGSGKTTVLSKRIEFLTSFKSVDPQKILAITFTRKARKEMESRISKSSYCIGVHVETFNSFCEKIVKQHNDLIYKRPTRVISYNEKIKIFRAALKENNMEPNFATDSYFSFGQRKEKTHEELLNLLMNDCYTVIDIYKSNRQPLDDIKSYTEGLSLNERQNVEMIQKICSSIAEFMEKFGLRDYSDQIMHCIDFLRKNPQFIPKFDHIMVDEYQDVNSAQSELLEVLNPKSLFCVGDPRQSIFGWRGSKIKYILNFEERHSDCEIITLSTNYRSSKKIVDLINKSMENSRLPDLKHYLPHDSKVSLVNFDSENDEMNFIIGQIKNEYYKNDVFVLARTNRMISDLSKKMMVAKISHTVRTEDTRTTSSENGNFSSSVTLATIHSIKGLEAEIVFVIGCTPVNFPCKAADHPIIELVKIDEYDKEEEERRLFYVAMSRAKNNLYLTYCGKNHTRFITPGMIGIAGSSQKGQAELEVVQTEGNNQQSNQSIAMNVPDAFSRLKMWRRSVAQKLNMPPYIIMHDKTLLEIISMNPIDVEDLRNVRGIGPSKLERYGNDIIKVLHDKK